MPKFTPEEDKYLIINLPGERLRAIIRRVVTNDAVIVEVTSIPLAKSHQYKRGDYVACRRDDTEYGESWRAVEEQRISVDELAQKEKQAQTIVKIKNKPVKKKKTKNKDKKKAKNK